MRSFFFFLSFLIVSAVQPTPGWKLSSLFFSPSEFKVQQSTRVRSIGLSGFDIFPPICTEIDREDSKDLESHKERSHLHSYLFDSSLVPFPTQSHGTTTLIVRHRDSLFITVDSKSSMKTYIVSDSVKKVRAIGSNYLATMAGGASDCHYFLSRLGKKIKKAEEVFRRRLPLGLIVKLLVQDIHDYRHLDLSIGTMLAGLDDTGPRLFYIDSEGNFIEGNYFSVGSGCQWAYAVLDSFLEQSPSISKQSQSGQGSFDHIEEEELVRLSRQAVQEACRRDLFSGGYINSLKINSTGIYPLTRYHFDSIPE